MRTVGLVGALVGALGCGAGGTPLDARAPDGGGADGDAGELDALAMPDASSVRQVTFTPPPRARAVETGVRREVFTVPTPAAPPNPTTSVATAAERNAVQVARYRQDTDPPAPVRAVVVAMPGILAGAGSFDALARALVRRGADTAVGGLEVWAVDRRSNLLEDLRGMDAAEAMSDPELATGYYLRRDTALNGQTFGGLLTERDRAVSFMAEWGLAVTLADLRAVIDLVPSSRDHVVLLGHSLGASVVEAYGAWDFAGTAGYTTLAGLALVDGVLDPAEITEAVYTDGSATGPMGMPVVGLTALRAQGPYFVALPGVGVQADILSEILARRVLLAPDAVVRDTPRDRLLALLLGVAPVPPLTNAAAFGFGFDDASCPLPFARSSLGQPVGPVRTTPNPFGGGNLSVPASGTETYRWTDAPAAVPREFTPIGNLARAWAASPTNFAEWYFPQRLALDLSAVGTLRDGPDSWQQRQGLRASHGGEVDVPVLAIGTALVNDATRFDATRARLSATVGPGRPNAGASRTDERGFRVLMVPTMTHVDPLSAADDNPDNPVPGAVIAFASANTASTAVTIPVR